MGGRNSGTGFGWNRAIQQLREQGEEKPTIERVLEERSRYVQSCKKTELAEEERLARMAHLRKLEKDLEQNLRLVKQEIEGLQQEGNNDLENT